MFGFSWFEAPFAAKDAARMVRCSLLQVLTLVRGKPRQYKAYPKFLSTVWYQHCGLQGTNLAA